MLTAGRTRCLIVVLILFQHMQLGSVGGFPITLGALAGMLLILLGSSRLLSTGFLCVGSVILLATTSAIFAPEMVDSGQFIRTLGLFAMSATVVGLGVMSETTPFANYRQQIGSAALFSNLVVVTFSCLQVIWGAAGSLLFFNPFGNRQYLYQYVPALTPGVPPRAQGFYLEPSYNAFVIGSATLVCLLLGRRPIASVAAGAVGLLVTQSATGLILLLALTSAYTVLCGGKRALVAVALAVSAMVTLGPYIVDRLLSITHTGSSANYRLQAPLKIISYVLERYPMGVPLGSLSSVVDSFGIPNGQTRGTSLDNGAYVLIFYFGWTGVAAVAALVVWMFAYPLCAENRRTVAPLVPMWLVGTLAFSGGVMLPEYSAMTFLVIVTWRVVLTERGRSGDTEPSTLDDRDRNPSGSPGTSRYPHVPGAASGASWLRT